MSLLPEILTIGLAFIKEISIAVASGIVVAIIYRTYKDTIDFVGSTITDTGTGRASTVYIYSGKQFFVGKDGSMELKEIKLPKELSDDQHDAHFYEFVDVEFKVNRSRQVRLRATMKYKEDDKPREAIVGGTGDYIRRDVEIKDGLATISCRFEEKETGEKWTATYFLRATPDGVWKGYWFLLDRRHWETTNFGMMEFKTKPKRWFSWLRGKTSRSTAALAPASQPVH